MGVALFYILNIFAYFAVYYYYDLFLIISRWISFMIKFWLNLYIFIISYNIYKLSTNASNGYNKIFFLTSYNPLKILFCCYTIFYFEMMISWTSIFLLKYWKWFFQLKCLGKFAVKSILKNHYWINKYHWKPHNLS